MLSDELDKQLRGIAAARAALDVREASSSVRERPAPRGSSSDRASVFSKQGIRKRHLAIDPIFARRPQRVPTIEEYHAKIAAHVRAQRRSAR